MVYMFTLYMVTTWAHIFFRVFRFHSLSLCLSVCVGVKQAASSSSSTPATLVENEVKIIMKKKTCRKWACTQRPELCSYFGVCFQKNIHFFLPVRFHVYSLGYFTRFFSRRFAFSAVLNVFLSKALYYLALRWKEMPFVFLSFVLKWNICICSPFRCIFSAVIWFIRNVPTSEHILKSRQVLTDYLRAVFSKGFIFLYFCSFGCFSRSW